MKWKNKSSNSAFPLTFCIFFITFTSLQSKVIYSFEVKTDIKNMLLYNIHKFLQDSVTLILEIDMHLQSLSYTAMSSTL